MQNDKECSASPQNGSQGHVPQEKVLLTLGKRDRIFAICTVIVSIFTAAFGICGGFALGYTLSVVLMMVLFGVYIVGNCKLHLFPTACGLLALMNSSVFVCTSNGSVRFFSFLISGLLSVVCFDGLQNGTVKGSRRTLGVFYGAASTVRKVNVSVKSLFSCENGQRKTIGKILIGFVCAVPVLLLVVPLLAASDDAFYGMTRNIFANTKTAILKTVFGLLLSPFLISYGFCLKKGQISDRKRTERIGIENVYIISFLAVIAACYLLYLFSQLAYFFSAFQGFLPNGGMTYAQYARKGFFEMCIIAVINLVLVLITLLVAKKQNGKVCTAVKVLDTFIAVFTQIIIATAISKMALYIDVYGMTVLRVTTSAFMLFLSVVFVSMILRIYITRINIIKVGLITAGCIMLVLGTVNVNAVCAKYNYESYLSGKLETIDVDALYNLGDEGIPYIVELASGQEKTIAQEARHYLSRAYLYDYFENMQSCGSFTVEDLKVNQRDKGFEGFSFPKAAAYDSLYGFLEENPQFGTQCHQLLLNDIS